jgi:hypothetical protein
MTVPFLHEEIEAQRRRGAYPRALGQRAGAKVQSWFTRLPTQSNH